jgi:hypothetical protein
MQLISISILLKGPFKEVFYLPSAISPLSSTVTIFFPLLIHQHLSQAPKTQISVVGKKKPITVTVLGTFSQNHDGIRHKILVGRIYLLLNRQKKIVGKYA